MKTTPEAPIIAGNWKLNNSPSEAKRFFAEFLPGLVYGRPGSLLFFPPAISFSASRDSLADAAGVHLGVQNIYWESSGAFTGEISASMARDAGAEVVLVGHSERRHVFGETDRETGLKVAAAFDAGLAAMLCVGEKIEEREADRANEVVDRQLEAVIAELEAGQLPSFSVAYEPVWAIGTGKTATAEDASAMHGHIRNRLVESFGPIGATVPILYGGSVKPANAAELLGAPDIDGVLVGGASLDPESFAAIWDARP